ncbi:hypothetical protein PLICRDRAFT_411858 [Plicaturopsis crispa FD-325 SS-3]|nr:hypothetical protein PLICRDRAFT_411858 [Plicaturopsis crispa FD-325 SS-3]
MCTQSLPTLSVNCHYTLVILGHLFQYNDYHGYTRHAIVFSMPSTMLCVLGQALAFASLTAQSIMAMLREMNSVGGVYISTMSGIRDDIRSGGEQEQA